MSFRTQTTTITFTLDQLNRRAATRPKGYAADILSHASSVDSNHWEISREHWDIVALRHRTEWKIRRPAASSTPSMTG